MSRIKVAPEQLRQVSTQLQQVSQQNQEMTTQLDNLVNGLQGAWEEPAKELFVQQFNQWKLAMTQYTQLMNSVAQQMNATASRFESIDSSN